MFRATIFVMMLAASPAVMQAAEVQANPIRKVVTMLTAMTSKIEAEGDKAKKLFEDFECYCKAGTGDMEASIKEAKVKIPQLGSDIEQATAEKGQLVADLKQHEEDRAAAITAIDEAQKVRNKDHDDFRDQEKTLEDRIEVMGEAINAIKGHHADSFLQTSKAQVIRNLLQNTDLDMYDSDKQEILSFLASGASAESDSDSPGADEITGILGQMKDEMTKSLKEITADEKKEAQEHQALVTAKTAEIDAAVKGIQEKTMRKGGLAVDIEEMKKDLADTKEGLDQDTKFVANFKKNCIDKANEFDKAEMDRRTELTAIAETIKMLDSDEAKDLLHESLNRHADDMSFLQVASSESKAKRALSLINKARKANGPDRRALDFVALALHGKKAGFQKVMDLIDDMVKQINKDQENDYAKRDECKDNLDEGASTKQELQRGVANYDGQINKAEEVIVGIKAEIEAEQDKIKFMDKEAAKATEIRKQEHQEYLDVMASDTAAKELVAFAKNRLQKFYQPSMYTTTEAPETESFLSLKSSPSLVQVSSHEQAMQKRDRPQIDTESDFSHESSKEEGKGVIGMLDKIINDLGIEIHEAEATENVAQVEYEETMKDAADGRNLDMKTLTSKKGGLADAEMKLQDIKEQKTKKQHEIAANDDLIASYHQDCDFLLEFFSHRKQAREDEIDALGKAKAVLAGSTEDMEDEE